MSHLSNQLQIAAPILPGALFNQKWAISEKNKYQGGRGYTFQFFEKTPGTFNFLLYLQKFQTRKQSSIPGNSTKLCYGNSKARGGGCQVLWKFPMIFFWSLFWKFHPTLCLVSFCFFCLVVQLRPVVHNNKQIRRNKQIQMDKELKEFNFQIPCIHAAQYNLIFSRNVDHPKIYLLFYSFRCPLASQLANSQLFFLGSRCSAQ